MTMKCILTFLSVSFLFIAQAEEEVREMAFSEVRLINDTIDSSLAPDQSKYTFHFPYLDRSKNRIIYSIDGNENKAKLTDLSFDLITTPGKHRFQFYYSENYFEVYSDSLEIAPQHHSVYQVVMMESRGTIITADKPVIYLYPEKKMDVSVELDIQGEATFMYPAYHQGWQFQASPSGELTFGENTYNYLFWESTQYRSFTSNELKSGFNVSGEEAVDFLEEKLTVAGLNSKEKADFITYWGPRLAKNDLNFVRFEFNETCNRYAALKISPEPKNTYRIFMLWMPIDHKMDISEQEIESFSRDGFCVLEWGGSEITNLQEVIASEN